MPATTDTASTPSTFLKRYTNILSLLDIIQNRRIVLTNAAQWRDKNDHLVLEAYRRRVDAAGVFAICMTGASETFHHWEIFGGPTGVCVEFDSAALIGGLSPALLHGPMAYTKFPDLRAMTDITPEAMPFLKRWSFRDEQEFRIVATSRDPDRKCIEVPIAMTAIRKIIFSPFIAPPLIEAAKSALEKLLIDTPMRPGFSIGQSGLTTNQEWLARIEQLAGVANDAG